MAKQFFSILVGEKVIGKSKGPKGYTRFKPVKYINGMVNMHVILYAENYQVDVPAGENDPYREIYREYVEVQRDIRPQLVLKGISSGPGIPKGLHGYNIIVWDIGGNKVVWQNTGSWEGIIDRLNNPAALNLDNDNVTRGDQMFNRTLSNNVLNEWGVI